MRKILITHAFCLALLAAGGCASMMQPQTVSVAGILADPARTEADKAQDARRKAADILALMRVRPGDQIFDIEAGGGYWTEILSLATGPDGKVVMQNLDAFAPRLKSALDARFAGGRMANVRQSLTKFDHLEASDGSIDLVTWVQGPHEVHFTPPSGVSLGDPAKAFSEIARVLRRGGRFVAIDHSALAGSGTQAGGTLHRIDPAVTIALASAAGLRLTTQAPFLANPDDPKTKSAFDPSIRGRTDQHILVFVKR